MDNRHIRCTSELLLDRIVGGSVEEVKRINTPEFYEKLSKMGRQPEYQLLRKNCLAKKYGVSGTCLTPATLTTMTIWIPWRAVKGKPPLKLPLDLKAKVIV